ncbi:hypothetical protein BKA62DRAFT_669364 [Auriculariales sp. MPI-PUGE-AT-0066]|nr:hypothetical protein BKA62DRAFT_669364 [Auriculariales sp. MPI-PUGE-AT-0066]
MEAQNGESVFRCSPWVNYTAPKNNAGGESTSAPVQMMKAGVTLSAGQAFNKFRIKLDHKLPQGGTGHVQTSPTSANIPATQFAIIKPEQYDDDQHSGGMLVPADSVNQPPLAAASMMNTFEIGTNKGWITAAQKPPRKRPAKVPKRVASIAAPPAPSGIGGLREIKPALPRLKSRFEPQLPPLPPQPPLPPLRPAFPAPSPVDFPRSPPHMITTPPQARHHDIEQDDIEQDVVHVSSPAATGHEPERPRSQPPDLMLASGPVPSYVPPRPGAFAVAPISRAPIVPCPLPTREIIAPVRKWKCSQREIRGIAGGRWFARSWAGEADSPWASASAAAQLLSMAGSQHQLPGAPPATIGARPKAIRTLTEASGGFSGLAPDSGIVTDDDVSMFDA